MTGCGGGVVVIPFMMKAIAQVNFFIIYVRSARDAILRRLLRLYVWFFVVRKICTALVREAATIQACDSGLGFACQ